MQKWRTLIVHFTLQQTKTLLEMMNQVRICANLSEFTCELIYLTKYVSKPLEAYPPTNQPNLDSLLFHDSHKHKHTPHIENGIPCPFLIREKTHFGVHEYCRSWV